jgi:hypothetical protein
MPLRLPLTLLAAILAAAATAAQEQAPAAGPAIPHPRLVTLRSDKVPLSKALAELARQTGVRVEDRRGEGDPQITINLQGVPFWKALDALAQAAGASVYLYPRGGQVSLVKRTAHQPPVSYDGFFRCSLKRVVELLDLETGADGCTVLLEVAWEPQLQPLLLETRPQNMRLLDDRGTAIPVPNDGSSLAPVDGRIALPSEVALPALPRAARAIGLLEGTLTVVAPSKMLTFTFDTLERLEKARAAGEEPRQQKDGVACRVTRVVLAKDHWTVQVTIEYPPGNRQLDSFQSWVVNNEMALESIDGNKRWTTRDYVLESASPQQAVLSYHFRDRDGQVRGRPQSWRLTYRTPAAIVEWPVRFSFKDVPLPGRPPG